MHAAILVDTYNIREAAVLGGIVRCVIATGGCQADYIAGYARDIIGAFDLVGVDRSLPCPAEIGVILDRFEAAYGEPIDRRRSGVAPGAPSRADHTGPGRCVVP